MTYSLNETRNPILDSVVHHPFQSASRDAGCDKLTESDFGPAIQPYLSDLADALGVRKISLRRLWTAMLAGEVIAAELSGGTLFFHVQGKAYGHLIDMRFANQSGMWDIQAVTSVHRRPLIRAQTISTLLTVIVGMAATGVVGYTLASRTPNSLAGVQEWAALHGYSLVPTQSAALSSGQAGNAVASVASGATPSDSTSATSSKTSDASNGKSSTSNSTSTSHATARTSAGTTTKSQESSGTKNDPGELSVTITSNNTSTTKPAPTNTETASQSRSSTSSTAVSTAKSPTGSASVPAQTYTFVFHSGMTVHDISVFLQQHNLVSNAYQFDQVLHSTGVEKLVWPGTYRFQSSMNQDQILQELKSHP